jgi:protein involved in polysaccharide export with SLBB domain
MEDGVTKEIVPFNLEEVLNKEGMAETLLRSDDAIKIYSLAEIEGIWWDEFVSISGHVKRAGRYELFEENMTLYDLIFKAGGFDDEEYLKQTYLKRAELVRIMEDGVTKEIVPFNLEEVLKKEGLADTLLRPDDAVTIYSLADIEGTWWDEFVSIAGHVKRPGQYELYEENMTLYDLIFKAGGFDDEEYLKQTYLKRAELVRIMEDGVTKEIIPFSLEEVLNKEGLADTLLRPDDAVTIYSLADIEGTWWDKFVSIAGHVKRPGQYELFEENMTLYDLIFKAGGFDDEEHLKLTYFQRAELVRVMEDSITKEIIPFNLGEVLNKEGLADTLLRPDDAVTIYSLADIEGALEKFVSISGHVKRPGQYELFEENMRLSDLLFQAGGFDDPVYRSLTFLNRADLLRLDEDRVTRIIIPFYLGEVLDNPGSLQNLALQPEDIIKVYSQAVFNAVRPVTIEGVVKNPGQYELKTGMTLKDLILEAGGVSTNVYRYKTEIARIDPENKSFEKFAEVISRNLDEQFSVSEVKYSLNKKPPLTGASYGYKNGSTGKIEMERREGFLLEPYDLVSIRPDPYFSLQRKVSISGEVMYPGDYTILSPDEKITDIIKRAGGLRPEAYSDGSRFTRHGQGIQMSFKEIIKNPNSNRNFNVQAGDSILIVKKPNLVYVKGEVNNPGIRKFVPGKRLRYYIDATGGYTPDADRRNVFVQLPNGDSFKLNHLSLFSPKVMDGSVVTIGKLPEEEPLDKTEFFKEVASIMADMAQVVILVIVAAGTGS